MISNPPPPPLLFYHGSCKRGILGSPKNVPEFPFYNYCNSFGDTFRPNHTLIFSKSSAPPKEFPFHVVDGKKITKSGVQPGPAQDFQKSVQKSSLIHTLNFFQSTFLDWKKFHVKLVSHTFELFVHDVELSIRQVEDMALHIP